MTPKGGRKLQKDELRALMLIINSTETSNVFINHGGGLIMSSLWRAYNALQCNGLAYLRALHGDHLATLTARRMQRD